MMSNVSSPSFMEPPASTTIQPLSLLINPTVDGVIHVVTYTLSFISSTTPAQRPS